MGIRDRHWIGEAAVELRFAPAAADRLVVLLEAWSPGWRAQVDGHGTPALRAGGFALAAWVPAGATAARFHYRPDGWMWGQRAAVIGLVLALGLIVTGQKGRATAGGATSPP